MDMKHLSLEQFAAFLDGNLPEADMQAVASAIDADPASTAVLGKTMMVDDLADWYAGQPEVMAESLAAEGDFVLPGLQAAGEPVDEITLHYVAAEEPEVAAMACAEPLCGEEAAVEENFSESLTACGDPADDAFPDEPFADFGD